METAQMIDFDTILTKMFEQVEPQFRAAQVAHYRDVAERQLEGWKTRMNGPKPENNREVWDCMAQPRYVVTADSKKYRYVSGWDELRDAINDGHYRVNYEAAERDANDSVDAAKAHFVSKQAKKLANATKNHSGKPKLTGKLSFSARITGVLNVEFGKGDCFSLDMSMIVNYRSGRRGYTSFYQFPARFVGVQIKGKRPTARVSEKWMEKNFK